MKIAIVSSYLPKKGKKTGGVSLAVHRLANRLAQVSTNTITVFGLCDQPEDAIYNYKILFPALKGLGDKQLFILYVLPILLNFVDFSNFDVVHLNGDDWFYLARKVPSVRTMHGSSLYEARTATSLKRKLLQYTFYPLEKLAAHLASVTIGVGPDSQALYKTDLLIGNGVDTNLFTPGVKTEFPSLFFIGTWGGRKRGEFLHHMFLDQVLPYIPSAKLYVVSDHWPSHPNVIPIEFPSDTDLAVALSKAWVFAYPSTYEGFGIPYIEAMSSGTSIVSSDNLGAQFVLTKGQYGIIAGDQDFGKSLVEILTNRAMRQMLETEGVKRASEFSWQEIVDQYMLAYTDAIKAFSDPSLEKMAKADSVKG